MLFRDKLCQEEEKHISKCPFKEERERIVNKFSFQELKKKNFFIAERKLAQKIGPRNLSTFWFYSGDQQLDYIASKVAIKSLIYFEQKKHSKIDSKKNKVYRSDFIQRECQQHKTNLKIIKE